MLRNTALIGDDCINRRPFHNPVPHVSAEPRQGPVTMEVLLRDGTTICGSGPGQVSTCGHIPRCHEHRYGRGASNAHSEHLGSAHPKQRI